jgi:hypothetical protein
MDAKISFFGIPRLNGKIEVSHDGLSKSKGTSARHNLTKLLDEIILEKKRVE